MKYRGKSGKQELAVAMIHVLKGKHLGVGAKELRHDLEQVAGKRPSDSEINRSAKMLQDHGIRVTTVGKGTRAIWFLNPDPAVSEMSMNQKLRDGFSEAVSNSRANRADPSAPSQDLADRYQSWAMDMGRRMGKTNAEVYAETITIYNNPTFERALNAP